MPWLNNGLFDESSQQMNPLSGLLQTIPAVQVGFKGRNLSGQKNTLSQLQGITDASYNPDNPIYQKLYQQNKENSQGDLASAIAEISRQNRKLTTMGRAPLLDQERGGESVFRNLVMGQQNAGQLAQKNTLDQLGQARQGLTSLYDANSDISNEDYNNNVRKALGYYSIGDALKGLFKL